MASKPIAVLYVRSVAHVTLFGLRNRVIVGIDDLVQVLGDYLGDSMQSLKVKNLCFLLDKLGQSK
jgi:hypothetical protein